MTRQRIVAAFVETLEDEAADDISMAAVAKRAKVAERTIYRHFKTRAELFAAAGEWIEDNVFSYIPFTSPDELPEIFRKLCKRFDRHPHLARAIAMTRAGRRVRAGFRRHLIDQHRKAMAPLVQHLPAKEVRQAEALASYLNNVLAWNAMREDFGMTDLGNAVPIVLTLLVTVLTNNLINGMALGTLSYIALEVAVGRRSQIPAMVWGLGVVFVAYAIVIAQIF